MPFGAALIGAGGSILGGILGSNAAQKAAGQQAQATNWATQAQEAEYANTQTNLNPFIGAGQAAIPQLQALYGQLSQPAAQFQAPGGAPAAYQAPAALNIAPYQAPAPFSFTQQDFQQSPGYQWQLQQGLGAVQNQASASGDALGGNTLKALQTYGTGLANQDWNNAQNTALQQYTTNAQTGLAGYQTNANTALNQYQTNANTGLAGYNANLAGYNSQFNNALSGYQTNFNANLQQNNQLMGYLQNLVGSGQNAASGLASAGQSMASNIGNLATQQGNANAAGTIGSSNALQGAIGGVANNLGAYSIANPNATTNSSGIMSWLSNLLGGGSSPSGVSPSVDAVLNNINTNPGMYDQYNNNTQL